MRAFVATPQFPLAAVLRALYFLWLYPGVGTTNMRHIYTIAAMALVVTGCQTMKPAASPMEAYLNRHAAAEAIARNCPAYGGYGAVTAMRSDADQNLARARALGATELDVQEARERMNSNLMSALMLVGPIEACNAFVNQLAWAGTSTAQIPKKAN